MKFRHFSFLLSLGASFWGTAQPVSAGLFEFVRIGDADGFGYGTGAGYLGADGSAANRGVGGVLQNGDLLPDLNTDGVLATGSGDDFDNRSGEGYSAVGAVINIPVTTGVEFTDIALSTSYGTSAAGSDVWNHNTSTYGAGGPFPDGSPAAVPNQPGFIFDFVVDSADITMGVPIFFNLVFGDYDVTPASIKLSYATAASETLPLTTQPGGQDGLIQGAFAVLDFGKVFTFDSGVWEGFVKVDFVAPSEPYTAFDYVELSVSQIVIPEPREVALAGLLGLAGFLFLRRRKARVA